MCLNARKNSLLVLTHVQTQFFAMVSWSSRNYQHNYFTFIKDIIWFKFYLITKHWLLLCKFPFFFFITNQNHKTVVYNQHVTVYLLLSLFFYPNGDSFETVHVYMLLSLNHLLGWLVYHGWVQVYHSSQKIFQLCVDPVTKFVRLLLKLK